MTRKPRTPEAAVLREYITRLRESVIAYQNSVEELYGPCGEWTEKVALNEILYEKEAT